MIRYIRIFTLIEGELFLSYEEEFVENGVKSRYGMLLTADYVRCVMAKYNMREMPTHEIKGPKDLEKIKDIARKDITEQLKKC